MCDPITLTCLLCFASQQFYKCSHLRFALNRECGWLPLFRNIILLIFALISDSFCAKTYLISLLDFTDLLSSCWVVDREDLPTHRDMPLIVDENLQTKAKFLETVINWCKLPVFCLLLKCGSCARLKHNCVCARGEVSCKTVLNIYGTFSNQAISAFRFQQHAWRLLNTNSHQAASPACQGSCASDMEENLQIWTEIPACPALLSGEFSTVQTKRRRMSECMLLMGWKGEYIPIRHKSPFQQPTSEHKETCFTTSPPVYDTYKTHAALGFCDLLKHVFR